MGYFHRGKGQSIFQSGKIAPGLDFHISLYGARYSSEILQRTTWTSMVERSRYVLAQKAGCTTLSAISR